MRRFLLSFLSIFCRYPNHCWFGFNPTFHIIGLDLLRFSPKVGLDLLRFSPKVGLDLKIFFTIFGLYLKILCIFVLDLKAFRHV